MFCTLILISVETSEETDLNPVEKGKIEAILVRRHMLKITSDCYQWISDHKSY